VYQEFGHAELGKLGGKILSSYRFSTMPQLPGKMTLATTKVVKIVLKIIIALC